MIASTVKLFCCHSEHKEIKDMFRQLQPYHPTHSVEEDDCLHSFFVAKNPIHIFYDAWIDSGIVQTKFLKTYEPKNITVPSYAKVFNYDRLYEVANYIQNLTGCKANVQEHNVNYKKQIAVDKDLINEKFENYIGQFDEEFISMW